MKVLGITETGSGYNKARAYIVQITHDEICAVANKSAYRKEIAELKIGDDYPISEGFDFRREIVEAMKAIQSAHEKFAHATATMTRFAALAIPREEQQP